MHWRQKKNVMFLRVFCRADFSNLKKTINTNCCALLIDNAKKFPKHSKCKNLVRGGMWIWIYGGLLFICTDLKDRIRAYKHWHSRESLHNI